MSKKYLFLLLSTLFIFNACGGGSGDDKNPETLKEKQKLVTSTARVAKTSEDYEKLALDKNSVQPWEDSMRTDGKKGSYEWWYNDFSFDDGTTVVVAFYTKLAFNTYGDASPMVVISIVDKDGKELQNQYLGSSAETMNLSSEVADIHVRKSYLTYKDKSYQLHYENQNIIFDANMT